MTFKQLYPRDKATFNAYNLDVINRHKVLLFCLMVRFWLTQRVFRGLGVLPTMAFTRKLRPKAVTFSGLKYMKGWGFLVADPGKGPGARPHLPPPPYFWTKLRPEGPKKVFWETAPPPAPHLISQGLDPALISPVEVYNKVKKNGISVWKRHKRTIRCILLLTVKKSRKRFVVWFIFVSKTVHLQGMWKGYHFSLEGIRKGHLVSVKIVYVKVRFWTLGRSLPV